MFALAACVHAPDRRGHVRTAAFLSALLVVAAMAVAGKCDGYPDCGSGGECPIVCLKIPGADSPICGGGGRGSGGGPAPTATPDLYSWIEDLPPPGKTADQFSEWLYCSEDVGCVPYFIDWYGAVGENSDVLDASDDTIAVRWVFLQLSIGYGYVWEWDDLVSYDTLYSQHTELAVKSIDPSCPLLMEPPDNFITLFGCNDFFSAPIEASGLNAIASFTPTVEPGGDVVPVLNTHVDFPHKVTA